MTVTGMRPQSAAKSDHWSTAAIRIALHAEQNEARAIGITGSQPGAGASSLALELASTFSSLNKSVLLIDASRPEDQGAAAGTARDQYPDLLGAARDFQSIRLLDLAEHRPRLPPDPIAARRALELVLANGTIVVVDLPPIAAAAMRDSVATCFAAACDIVYLVCLSGETRKPELASQVEISRISGVKLGGIVANDWKLFGSQFLTAL